MLIKSSSDIASSEITDQKQYVNRRDFLKAAGIAAAGLAGGLIAAESAIEAKGASHGRKLANINRAFPKPDDKNQLVGRHHQLQQFLRVRDRQRGSGRK